jgi:hypothetical protein
LQITGVGQSATRAHCGDACIETVDASSMYRARLKMAFERARGRRQGNISMPSNPLKCADRKDGSGSCSVVLAFSYEALICFTGIPVTRGLSDWQQWQFIEPPMTLHERTSGSATEVLVFFRAGENVPFWTADMSIELTLKSST